MGYIVVKESGHKYPRLVQTPSSNLSREEAIKQYKQSGKAVKIKSKPKPKTTKKILYVDDPLTQQTRPATPYEQQYYEEHGELPKYSTEREEYEALSRQRTKPEVKQSRVIKPERLYVYDASSKQTRPATEFEKEYYAEHGQLPVAKTPYEQHFLDTAPEIERTTTKEGIIYTIREFKEPKEERLDLEKERHEYLEARRKYREGKISEYEYATKMLKYQDAISTKSTELSSKMHDFYKSLYIKDPFLNIFKKVSPEYYKLYTDIHLKAVKGGTDFLAGTYYTFESGDLLVEKAIFAGEQFIKAKAVELSNIDYSTNIPRVISDSGLPIIKKPSYSKQTEEGWISYETTIQEFKDAGSRAGNSLIEQYNPLKPENWFRIGMTALAIKGLADLRASYLNAQKVSQADMISYRMSYKDPTTTKAYTVVSSEKSSGALISTEKGTQLEYFSKLKSGGYRVVLGSRTEEGIVAIDTVVSKTGKVVSQDVVKIRDALPYYKTEQLPVPIPFSEVKEIPKVYTFKQVSPNLVIASIEQASRVTSKTIKTVGLSKIETSVDTGIKTTSSIKTYVSNYIKKITKINPVDKTVEEWIKETQPKLKIKPPKKGSKTLDKPKVQIKVGKEHVKKYISKEGTAIITREKEPDVFIVPSTHTFAYARIKTESRVPYIFSSYVPLPLHKKPTTEAPPTIDIPTPPSPDKSDFNIMFRDINIIRNLPTPSKRFYPTSMIPIFGLDIKPSVSTRYGGIRTSVSTRTKIRYKDKSPTKTKHKQALETSTFQEISTEQETRSKEIYDLLEETIDEETRYAIFNFTSNLKIKKGQEPPKLLFPFKFNLRNLEWKQKKQEYKLSSPRQYTPSLTAIMFKIRGKKPKYKTFTGIEIRPIPRGWKIWKM